MELLQVLTLVLLAGGIAAQGIPVFEPLSSSEGIAVLVDERSSQGTEVLAVRARGPLTETVLYGIDLPQGIDGLFQIDSMSGNITVGVNGSSRLVVRDGMPTVFSFDVFAYFSSSGLSGSRAYLPVTATVRDFNDPPMFPMDTVVISVLETISTGTTIGSVLAMDEDLGDNGILTYSLTQPSPTAPQPSFTIHPFTASLTVSGSIDVDTDYQLIVTARDEGSPPLSDSTIVTVRIDPIPPVFEQTTYSASIAEFTGTNPSVLRTVRATPNNIGETVLYSVSSSIPANGDVTFTIGQTTGTLSVSGTVDRETLSRYFVTVDATVDSSASNPSQALVLVDVTDVNEPPVFVSSHYITSVPEGATIGSELFSGILAIDNDEGSNAVFTYSIVNIYAHRTLNGARVAVPTTFFVIVPSTGVITVNTNLEREASVDGYHYYEVIVSATDSGSPPLTSNTTLTVAVTDVNDNPPQFNSTTYTFFVSENLPPLSQVGVFEVTDLDSGAAAENILTLAGQGSERFSVEIVNVTQMSSASSQPPVVTLARVVATQPLDRENVREYDLILTAADRTDSPLMAAVPVNVTVLDTNDNEPLFLSPSFSFSISEGTTDLFIMEFTVTDADVGINSEVDFSLSPSAASLFSLQSSGPRSTELSISHLLDRENVDVYSFSLFAIDRGSPQRTGSTATTINITDVNDNSPVFFSSSSFNFALTENSSPGTTVGSFEATDRDLGSAGEIHFSLGGQNSDRFTVEVLNLGNPTRARILTTQMLDREDIETYQLTLMGGDRTNSPLSSTVPVTISLGDLNDNAPVFSQPSWVFSLSENTNSALIVTFNITDADSGTNANLDVSLDSSADGLFSLVNSGSNAASLFLTHFLDRETRTSYSFVVTATDRGQPTQTGQTQVTVNVADVNDNPPLFNISSLAGGVLENVPVGTFIADFEVVDIDNELAAESNFSLSGLNAEKFSVEVVGVNQRLVPQSVSLSTVTRGRVSTAQAIDREDTEVYQLTLTAQDLSNSPMSASIPLVVGVMDVNDNSPMFAQPSWDFSLRENTNNVLVMEFNITDEDLGINGEVEFSLDPSAQGTFSLVNMGPSSIELYLSNPLDREAVASTIFRIFAIDRGLPPLVGQTEITITVLDENDNNPIFTEDTYEITIIENLPSGMVVGRVVATDADVSSNGRVAYSSSPQQLVTVDNMTGEVVLLTSPDFETLPMQSVQVVAMDFGSPQRFDNATVIITVTDASDFAPVFQQGTYNVSISEDIQTGSQVTRTVATDSDFDAITYAIVGGDQFGSFSIDNVTGSFVVDEPLDRERVASYQIIVRALDDGTPQLSSLAVVNIDVTDVNDNSPEFIGEPYAVDISEGMNGSAGAFVFAVSAVDADSGENGVVQYFFFGVGTDYFNINQTTGEIRVAASGVDFEVVNAIGNPLMLTLVAQDNGTPLRASVSSINITVVDSNDNAPAFLNPLYSVTLPEGLVQTTQQVLSINASDADSGSNGEITYSITGEVSADIRIDPVTGILSLEAGAVLDRDTNFIPHNDDGDAVFSFGVAAMDAGSPPLISYTTVFILVSDINDNAPIFQSSFNNLTLSESLPVSTAILNLVATDSDFGSNGLVSYSVLSERSEAGGIITESFTLAVDSEGVVTLIRPLDRETTPTFTVVIAATDQGVLTNQANATVVVTVTDSNDNPPVFVVPSGGYVENILENTTIGFEVITVVATDLDLGANQIITYSLSSNNSLPFAIPDPTIGMIVVSDDLDRETASEYELLVTARDSAINSETQEGYATVRIIIDDINDNTPVFSSNFYMGVVSEGAGIGSTVQVMPQVMASDADTTPFFFALVGDFGNTFEIDPQTGVIEIQETLDYEQIRVYPNLVLVVFDEDLLHSNATIDIAIQDENDNSPTFVNATAQVSVPELTPTESEVFIAVATDADDTRNSLLMYSLDLSDSFLINSLSGAITVGGELDYETQRSYTLVVTATDGGTPARSSNLILTVDILDRNDNPPSITNPMPTYSIVENIGVSALVGVIDATDDDSGGNAELMFAITAGNEANRFSIDRVTGSIFTNASIDREEQSVYSLTVEVRDASSFPLTDQTVVTVNVLDENDNAPIFPNQPSPTVSELAEPNTQVVTLFAVDNDEGSSANITYSFLSPDGFVPFDIGASSGILTTTISLDFETQSSYNLIITASDSGTPSLNFSFFMVISVLDENDNAPQFAQTSNEATIPENSAENVFVANLAAVDGDSGTNSEIIYSIVATSQNPIFRIDNTSGIVLVSRPDALDFEVTPMFVLQVQARDMGNPPASSQTLLIVNLVDVNDNAPQFPSLQPVDVEESRVSGSILTTFSATDADQGSNAALTYSIVAGDTFEQFRVQPSGSLVLQSDLDYEVIRSYNLTISAMDSGFPPLSGTANLIISILDTNDNPPLITTAQALFAIPENVGLGSEVIKVDASDADSGSNGVVTFRLVNTGGVNSPFLISPISGSLSVEQPLDRETIPQYTFIIEVADSGSPSLVAQQEFMLDLVDVNDNAPLFSEPPTFRIDENQGTTAPFNFVTSTDADEGSNQLSYYFITGGPDMAYIEVDAPSGFLFLRMPVDYDNGTTELRVELSVLNENINPGPSCSDVFQLQPCTSVALTVFINDINDNSPVFDQPDYDFSVNRSTAAFSSVGTVQATDLDSNNFGRVQYTIIQSPPMFSVGQDSGLIGLAQYNPSADPKFFEFTVNATDNAGATPSFMSTALVKVYFIEDENLVVITVRESKSQVDSNLDQIKRDLQSLSSNTIRLLLYDTREFTTTMQVAASPNRKRQATTTVTVIRTNITVFGTNDNARTVLNSSDVVVYLNDNLGSLGSIGSFAIESIQAYPLPTSGRDLSFLLYVYIAAGVLGGIILLSFLILIFVCCCCCCKGGRKQKYRPTEIQPKLRKKQGSEMKNYKGPQDSEAYQNPAWDDPYGNTQWPKDTDAPVKYNERSVDAVDTSLTRKQKKERRGKRQTDEYAVDEIDEFTIEVKPDQQSLSQASTTLERRGKIAAEEQPLINQHHRHPSPPPVSAERKKRDSGGLVRVKPMIDITAPEDDEEEEEEEEEVKRDLVRSEESSEEESSEEENSDEENSEEEGSEETSETSEEESTNEGEEESSEDEQSDREGFEIPAA